MLPNKESLKTQKVPRYLHFAHKLSLKVSVKLMTVGLLALKLLNELAFTKDN